MSSRQRSIRTEGVILRRRDFGEKDRILTIFTRKLGRISAIAKGVRNPGSRKSGHVETFMRSNLLIARGRNLHILTQAEVLDSYPSLRESLPGIGYGSYVVELVDAFTYEEGSNLPLYSLLVTTLEHLDRGDFPPLVFRYYELQLLEIVGFRPELFHCVNCREEIKEADQFLSGMSGGVVCPSCSGAVSEVNLRRISARELKYLRHIQRNSYSTLVGLEIPAEVLPGIEGAMGYFLTHILESELNSPGFLDRMNDFL